MAFVNNLLLNCGELRMSYLSYSLSCHFDIDQNFQSVFLTI